VGTGRECRKVANPTQKVPIQTTEFADTKKYWQVTTANNPGTYQNCEMMGLRADGFADHMDDTQALRFLGIWQGIQETYSGTTPNFASRNQLNRPQFLEIPIVTTSGAATTASRLTDIGKAVYAYDSGHVTMDPTSLAFANLVGFIEDVVGSTGFPDATTGTFVVVRPATAGESGHTKSSPTALAGDVNNYSPTALLEAAPGVFLRVDPGGSNRNITGLIAGRPGQVVRLINLGAANTLILKHQSGSSSAANRFFCSNLADAVVSAGAMITLVYDQTLGAWRVPAGSASITNSSGGSGTTIAATSVQQTIIIPAQLLDFANAAVWTTSVPFAFTVLSALWRTGKPASTANKGTTLTLSTSAGAVTGGVMTLTTANQNTTGGTAAATAISGANATVAAGGTIIITPSSTTTFVEGDGWVEITVTDNDLANALTALAGR
jgi:hypothetical protein